MPIEPHPTDPDKLIMRAGRYNPQKPWRPLTDEERASFEATLPKTQEEWDKLFNGIEASLKVKNT